MVNQTNLWSMPATILAIVAISLTVIGWIVTAVLAHNNNSKNLKKLELNRLIDELYFKLDFIYNEMLEILEKPERDKAVSYYLFISSVRQVEFTCKRIQSLDKEQAIDTGFIAELRQSCTDDRKYEPNKVGTTLTEIQYIAEKLKTKYSKKF